MLLNAQDEESVIASAVRRYKGKTDDPGGPEITLREYVNRRLGNPTGPWPAAQRGTFEVGRRVALALFQG